MLLAAASAGAGVVCATSVGFSKSGAAAKVNLPAFSPFSTMVNFALSAPPCMVYWMAVSLASASVATTAPTVDVPSTTENVVLVKTGAAFDDVEPVPTFDQGLVPSLLVARTRT